LPIVSQKLLGPDFGRVQQSVDELQGKIRRLCHLLHGVAMQTLPDEPATELGEEMWTPRRSSAVKERLEPTCSGPPAHPIEPESEAIPTAPPEERKPIRGAKAGINARDLSQSWKTIPCPPACILAATSSDPIPVPSVLIIFFASRTVSGSLVGTPSEIEDALAFSALQDIRPMVKTVSLDEAPAAFENMMKGKVRFRFVIKMR